MTDYLDIFFYVMGSLEMLADFCFFTGFLQKKVKPLYYILFVAFGTAFLETFRLEGILEQLVFFILLMAAGKMLCRAALSITALYAVVTIEIMNLCFGLFNSLFYILSPNPGVPGLIMAGVWNILSIVLAVLCYRIIQQCCTCDESAVRKYAFLILMPDLLIFLSSEYINESVYGNTVTAGKDGMLSGVNPYQILVMQALGVASLFCIMFSYKKLAESFRLNKEAEMLEMQAHSLKQYVEEAKLRYEKTKSFRHDIKNHITVVKELLQNKKTEAALRYVEGMENLTSDLSFPVSTNHPVLDILLGNKLGIAQENQIEVQCSLVVPYPCGISDIDFCIILGNALDNAVSACNRIRNERQRYIHVIGKVQGDFLFIEIENSCIGRRTIRSGTGLTNIRMAVEKYHGAMEIRTEGEKFVLSILIIISQQLDNISQQMG
ncbi:MAG: GHKL domain-containing protein [Lachnospiraceae bacterium]|nr:GHKL domain-containing protein [Lachnospiraceae bacterium]